MTQASAQQVLLLVTVLAGVAWLAGARFLIQSKRVTEESRDDALFGPQAPASSVPRNLVVGHVELEGTPETLSTKFASRLAGATDLRFADLMITERTADRVCFESKSPVGGQYGLVRRGQLLLGPAQSPERTSVDYAIEISPGRGLLTGGAVFCFLGLAAIGVSYWAFRTFVVPSPDPAVRWQVFQSLQVAHFLWPPFLFGGLFRWRRRAVESGFDALMHNLPYVEVR